MMSSRTSMRRVSDLAVQVRPARPDEYDMLVARAVQVAGRESLGANAFISTIGHDPRFVPDHLRLVEVDGEYAGMLVLIDRFVRFGVAVLRCAILVPFDMAMPVIASAAAMRDMLSWAAGQGFHFAMRWSMTPAGPDQGFGPGQKTYTVVLPAGSRSLGDCGYTVRPATAADAPALASWYHAATATALLAETRSDEPWQWRSADERQQIDVAVDPMGEVRGYALVVDDAGMLRVQEIATFDDGPAQTLFDHFLRRAKGREVRVMATPENRWSRWAFVHGASFVAGPGAGYGAVRVLDLRAFLQAARPELERRLQESEFAGTSGRLRLETPLGSVGLVVDDGRLSFDEGRNAPLVTLPWAALGSLVIGYRNVESLLVQPGVCAEGGQAVRLLQVLFPEAYAHWSPPACF